MMTNNFVSGGGYSAPTIEEVHTPVECGFQGSTFTEAGVSSKTIEDPNVVTLDTW